MLYQSGKPDDAKALVLSDKGLFLMNDIRKLMGEMGAGRDLSAGGPAGHLPAQYMRVTKACIYLASFIAAFGLMLLAYYIQRESALRERATPG